MKGERPPKEEDPGNALPGMPDDSIDEFDEPTKDGAKSKARNKSSETSASVKRRCVSTACIACRKRKSKCDGNTPSCAACSSVYGTECVYDPNSDHRRKGVYKKDIDNLKTRNSTLHTLIQAILDWPEDEVPALVRQIRSSTNLDDVAESILSRENGLEVEDDEPESPVYGNGDLPSAPTFESELSGKMGELRLENGSVKYIGGTSNLIFVGSPPHSDNGLTPDDGQFQQEGPITSWTNVTTDLDFFKHLMNMYFTWHYPYFTTLSKSLFYRDFLRGKPADETPRRSEYCSPLLVNAMLALGCHFSSWPGARTDPEDSATAGDHFFREAKRLTIEDDEHEKPKLATVQALALMSVREAGCGREGSGWVYSGMSFRMACDLGLNVDSEGLTSNRDSAMDEEEIDARRVTFWGCFLFDKCWSNYLGRQPQLPVSSATVPKFDVFPVEDAATWSPYTDSGVTQAHSQPARTRSVALYISSLCEISSDLLISFYHPTNVDKPASKSTELKKLSELHTRLEAWRKNLPKEMEPKEGALPPVLLMHMFFQLLFIHLFRPFLKYNQSTSPLPAHISPRKLCTHAASLISKLLRLYKRTYGLRQICNVAVYIAHSACTIHLLNLPEKTAKRDIIHGVKHLEEIAEGWLCARRTLGILSVLTQRWHIQLPDEAVGVLARADAKYGRYTGERLLSPKSPSSPHSVVSTMSQNLSHQSPHPTNANAMNTGSGPQSRRPSEPIVFPPGSGLEQAPHQQEQQQRRRQQPHASPATSISQSQRYSAPQTMQPSFEATWASAAPSMTAMESPHGGLYLGTNGLSPDTHDWWLKDQSALAVGFDNWNGIEASSPLMTDVNANAMGGINYGVHAQPFNGFGNNEWYG